MRARRARGSGRRPPVVGDEVDGPRVSLALALEVHDHPSSALAVEADLHLARAEIARGLVANAPKREGVVSHDGPVLLDVEELVVGLRRRQETDTAQIEAEAIDRFHAERAVLARVVFVLDPAGKFAIEGIDARKVERAGQEGLAHSPEETFDLPLRRAIAYRRVAEQAPDARADLRDLLASVDGAVVDVEGVRNAAFVERRAQGGDERVGVLREEKLTVAADAAGVVDEGDELALGLSAAGADVRPEHPVGLPPLVRVRLANASRRLFIDSASGLSSSCFFTSRRNVVCATRAGASAPRSMQARYAAVALRAAP